MEGQGCFCSRAPAADTTLLFMEAIPLQETSCPSSRQTPPACFSNPSSAVVRLLLSSTACPLFRSPSQTLVLSCCCASSSVSLLIVATSVACPSDLVWRFRPRCSLIPSFSRAHLLQSACLGPTLIDFPRRLSVSFPTLKFALPFRQDFSPNGRIFVLHARCPTIVAAITFRSGSESSKSHRPPPDGHRAKCLPKRKEKVEARASVQTGAQNANGYRHHSPEQGAAASLRLRASSPRRVYRLYSLFFQVSCGVMPLSTRHLHAVLRQEARSGSPI